MVSLTTFAIVMPDAERTVVRLPSASSTCLAMSEVVGGEPSSPVAVWPEQSRTCDVPARSTACENPNAFDHSHGLTSVRSIVFSLIEVLDTLRRPFGDRVVAGPRHRPGR